MPRWIKALFLDVPFLIDSAWRRLEYRAHAECRFKPGVAPAPQPQITLRPFWRKPPFWLFAITVFFVSYGPTWGGLCAILPVGITAFLTKAIGAAIVAVSLLLGFFAARSLWTSIKQRFGRIPPAEISFGRTAIVIVVPFAGLVVLTLLGVSAGLFLTAPSDSRACAIEDGSRLAVARFLVCVVAIALFAWVTSRRTGVVREVWAQTAILLLVAVVQWFVLADSRVVEASDLPYRHVFTAWATCILLIVAAAPFVARRMFAGLPREARDRFRERLGQTELFVSRAAPTLSWNVIGYAIFFGPAYQPLPLLLLPALVALVAPAKWLYLFTAIAALVSLMVLVWGSVSARWQELTTYIERWFLRGVPFLISLFVILIAALRLLQVDYISTILDSMPFGMAFGLVVMNYVLFWLAEYWMNRVASVHLLDTLGPVTDHTYLPYILMPTFAPNPRDPIRVHRDGRFLTSHGTGRLAVVGTLQPRPGEAGGPVRAFHSYSLTELFGRLSEGAGDPLYRADVTDLSRRLSMYFLWLNLMMLAVALIFVGIYVRAHAGINTVRPVVTVRAAPPSDHLRDLSSLLQQKTAPARPAVVVVGSGGGTRAAIYTASVLRGLHRLTVDRDIVLLSGVSGGGAALAYFAANRDALTVPSQHGRPVPCPDAKDAARSVEEEWSCFTKSVTRPFIEDVLNGASEWRIFTRTALSVLLAESFEKHLLVRKPSLASFSTPLILNTAITGHPAEESKALNSTIDRAQTCGEDERPFNLLSGGRLIFTNLHDIEAFPTRDSPLPDVRQPYVIVRDGSVPLAVAAALNANFPPVFPNARVRVAVDRTDKTDKDGCDHRSYYVTDGGAQENLGLISALYALQGALARIPDGVAVRPIHLVIAEASAVSYDYSQDRGISVAFSGSRERLAGGLTNELLDRVQQQAQRLKSTLQLHYLGLPLAFRARGGFGTHWMYAKEFNLSDPRTRAEPWYNFLPFTRFRTGKAVISRADLEELWVALHDPDRPFCDQTRSFSNSDSKKVQGWVCGSAADAPRGRDLHLAQWNDLVTIMRSYQQP